MLLASSEDRHMPQRKRASKREGDGDGPDLVPARRGYEPGEHCVQRNRGKRGEHSEAKRPAEHTRVGKMTDAIAESRNAPVRLGQLIDFHEGTSHEAGDGDEQDDDDWCRSAERECRLVQDACEHQAAGQDGERVCGDPGGLRRVVCAPPPGRRGDHEDRVGASLATGAEHSGEKCGEAD